MVVVKRKTTPGELSRYLVCSDHVPAAGIPNLGTVSPPNSLCGFMRLGASPREHGSSVSGRPESSSEFPPVVFVDT